MIPLIATLVTLRRAAGIQGQEIARTLGLGSTAGPSMVSRWESGQTIPTAGHTIGYAHAVGHQVIVTRDGTPVDDLASLLPNLAGLRQAARLSQDDVARCLWVTRASVGHLERSAGPRTHLDALLRYLGVTGHALDVAVLEAVAL